MENTNSSGVGLWCSAVASLLMLYVAAYGFLRWQDVLLYDVKMWTAADGMSYSKMGVRDNPYGADEVEPWQRFLGPPAESFFHPLCEIEDYIRLRKFKAEYETERRKAECRNKSEDSKE